MINPTDYAKAGTEHAHQTALFIWASLPEQQRKYPQLRAMFAIPNGGLRDKITAARLKASGVKSGVPDIFLPVPRRGFHGLFIEMKKPKVGRVSDEQTTIGDMLLSHGYYMVVCYSWAEAKTSIEWYMEGLV